ncbi:type II toxin-antitoxin system RelE/ParE family toxin [Companilactobacillus furfuricola]|uniref:type II toxin-antitoxin system RelE/ParE family toxin n=1 Tax=Companilactobacillus furfuricola TaxID=1462575 RepID=UPI0024824A45|nr:type II toxin-antitoxin system RelE/ParE family toxin [Companilactobacillus furfuricola]
MGRAKKDFPEKIAKKLLRLVNFIKASEDVQSIINNPLYYFHKLHGKKEGLYSMDIDGRRSSYRLIVTFDNNMDTNMDSLIIQEIIIVEVSKHYE